MDSDDSCGQKLAYVPARGTKHWSKPSRCLLNSIGVVLLLVPGFLVLVHPLPAVASSQSQFDLPWKTHQGSYSIVAVSLTTRGQAPAPSTARITELLQGNGDPVQKEPSVQANFADIGVHLHITVESAHYSPGAGIDPASCSATTVGDEFPQALVQDPSIARADVVAIFTPYKRNCSSGGVTQGSVIELESPRNGWIDPRMIEHELGHALLGLSHSGVTTGVGRNTLDSTTTTGSQYGPDSVMGAGAVGWSGPDQLVAGDLHRNQVVTVSASGTYVIHRRELDGDTTHSALLRIPLRGHTGFYAGAPREEVVLEYEVRTGADADSARGRTQVIAETWSEQSIPGDRLVPMTWEVGRLTAVHPVFTINLPADRITVTEIARTNTAATLHVVVAHSR